MPGPTTNLCSNKSQITAAARSHRYRQMGRAVWFTGVSDSSKSTTVDELACRWNDRRRPVYLPRGDSRRRGLRFDLVFTPAGVAQLLTALGGKADAGSVHI